MSEVTVKVGKNVNADIDRTLAVQGRKPNSGDVEGQASGGLLAFCPHCSTLVDYTTSTSLGSSYVICWNCSFVFEITSTNG
jgi:hypothetical protein